jgi:hypothetical protein
MLAIAFAILNLNAGYVNGSAKAFAKAKNEYSFKVTNKTKIGITKILASEDGEKYGFFDIGKGIKPGETITLIWDKSTDESNCGWYFKAVFTDGEESEAVDFDFCEDSLELVFD